MSLSLSRLVVIIATALTKSRAHKTGGICTNQVLASCEAKCFTNKVCILGLFELEKRSLQLLFVVVGADIDALARHRVNACIIHYGRNCARRGILYPELELSLGLSKLKGRHLAALFRLVQQLPDAAYDKQDTE